MIRSLLLKALSAGSSGSGPIASAARRGGKRYDARQSGGRQHKQKRQTKDTIQGNHAMAVVGGGDAAGEKHNKKIEAMTAVVGTVGVAMDGGEVRAKGKMSGWQTIQGDWAAEYATGGRGG